MASILIVDDDPIMVSTLEYCLRGEKHTLQAVSTGEETLRLITQRVYDLIILDVALPGMDGLETLRRIRNVDVDISVIMLTGYGHVGDATQALELGADDYVLKPVDPDAFVCRVDTTLKKSRFIEEKLSEKEIQSNIRLAAGLCHHLNNMLCVITGRSSMMLDDPDLPSRLREECEEIAGMAGEMSTLMQRLSSISRSDTPTQSEVVPMRALEAVIKEFGIHPKIRMVISKPEEVYKLAIACSRPRLHQLFRELLQNAVDAMSETGELHLEASVGGLPETPRFNLVIRDQGPGIAAHHAGMIFQPFFSTRRTLGLGLPVALSICAQLGGRLSVQNASSGNGVEARLSIPVRALAEGKGAVTQPAGLKPLIRNILVIDDEQAIVKLSSRMLSRMGFEVKTETDGQAAVQQAASLAAWADLVFLDIMLGAVNGVEVYRALRQHGKEMPIVFISGFSVNSMMDDLLQEDPHTRFISKPFDVTALKGTIRSLGSFNP